MTPSGMRGVLNDAVSIYFLDAILSLAGCGETHDRLVGGPKAVGPRRFVPDSPLEGAVNCELVSEMKLPPRQKN
jgi:hypothetical protein